MFTVEELNALNKFLKRIPVKGDEQFELVTLRGKIISNRDAIYELQIAKGIAARVETKKPIKKKVARKRK